MKGGGNERRSSAWRRRWFVRQGEPGRHHDVYTDSDQQKGGGMKRLVLLVAVVGTTLALAAGMALAQATTVTSNETVPVNLVVFNPCTEPEEFVLVTGELHLLFHSTVDANGGLHVQQHSQPQGGGLLGTGEESGIQYRVVGVTRDETYVPPGDVRETTFVNRFHIVTQGPSDNALVDITTHVTFNANGEPTAVVERAEIKCAG
jgi:hypothetical protein